MHRTKVALAKPSGPKLPIVQHAKPYIRLQAEGERRAALLAMRSEDAYVARYRALPRGSMTMLQVSGMSNSAGSSALSDSKKQDTGRFKPSDLLASSSKKHTSSKATATISNVRTSSSVSSKAQSPRSLVDRRAPSPGANEEDDESSWAFGGGRRSQGGPASEASESKNQDASEHKIEFIVHGSAGKGATPNYGQRRRYTHETDKALPSKRPTQAQGEGQKDQEIAQQYRHEYAPTSRSPRPLPHHTYFSTPSSSFNDDAAATAAGAGPVGVGGPRSGLGMGAGTHTLDKKASITRKKSALILPGQGSQYIGMTDDIFRTYRAARQVWGLAEEALVLGASGTGRTTMQQLTAADDGVPAEQREQFEHELAKSAEWDPNRHRLGAGTAVTRSRRGWLRDLVFSGDQLNLTRSENAQPSILVSSLSILNVLRQEFAVDLIANHIDYVAGHGSGIYAALCASDMLSLPDAVRMLRHRGLASAHFLAENKVLFPEGSTKPESVYETWAFANAGSGKGAELLTLTTIGIEQGGVPPTNSTSDADVVRKESDALPRRGWRRSQMSGCTIRPGKLAQALRAIERIASDIKAGKVESVSPDEVVEVANINSSLQIVLSGTRVGVSMASDQLRQLNLGARAVNLPVSGPYHSSLMQDSADFVTPAIDVLPLHSHKATEDRSRALKLVSSVGDARLLSEVDDIRSDLKGALMKPVMWLKSIDRMLENGVQRFICLGPGRACAHLLSKELAYRDRLAASQGKPPGNYEVWSINSVEDVEQIGALLSRLSAEEGATRSVESKDHMMAI